MLQETCGKCPRATAEFEDGMRGAETSMCDQLAGSGILVKALPILPRAKAVIETLRLFRLKVATGWLANAHTRILAASAFSSPFVTQLPGLAN